MLTENQAIEILKEHERRHPNEHLLRAAIQVMQELKADRDFLVQQRTGLYKEIDKLHKLCDGGMGADT